MKLLNCAAIFLFLLPGPVVAERPSGSDLLRDCKKAIRSVDGERGMSAQDIADGSWCLSYLQGIRDALTIQYAGHGDTAVMCLPHEVTASQLARIFINWAEANPERLHEDAFSGVLYSFFPRFACPG